MIVKINNHEYELKETRPYIYDEETVTLNVLTDSVDELVTVIGQEATVVIPENLAWNGLIFEKITKSWNEGPVCEIIFRYKNLVQTVETHTDDIEAISEAVVELAEIIGGDK